MSRQQINTLYLSNAANIGIVPFIYHLDSYTTAPNTSSAENNSTSSAETKKRTIIFHFSPSLNTTRAEAKENENTK